MDRAYRAGTCNIGPKNRLGRLAFGIFFYSLGVWGWAFLVINRFPPVSKALLFFLFYLGFLGMYEAFSGFCVLQYRKRAFDMR